MSYGPDGSILPALAERWTERPNGATFTLRKGVQFTDGEAWNCAVAKLNFDHVFAEPLRSADWHGWYKLPSIFKSVSCNGDFELLLETKVAYSGLLQELTFIRPLRMLSPASFMTNCALLHVAQKEEVAHLKRVTRQQTGGTSEVMHDHELFESGMLAGTTRGLHSRGRMAHQKSPSYSESHKSPCTIMYIVPSYVQEVNESALYL